MSAKKRKKAAPRRQNPNRMLPAENTVDSASAPPSFFEKCDISFKKHYKKIVCALMVWFLALIAVAVVCEKMSDLLSAFSNSLEIFIGSILTCLIEIVFAYAQKKLTPASNISFFIKLLCLFITVSLLCINTTRLIALCLDSSKAQNITDLQPEPIATIAPTNQAVQADQFKTSNVYEKKLYSLAEDLFIEEVDAYYGFEKGTIGETEAPQKRADLILKAIETETAVRKTSKPPKNYSAYCAFADFQYETYLNQLKRASDVKRTDILPEIKSARLNDLEDAKKHRALADEQYKDPANQQCLALYCIDLCDEYRRDKNTNSALLNLEEGASWAVQSMFNAAVDGKIEEMEAAYKTLEKIADRLDEMIGEIGEKNIERVSNCLDAYKIVLEICGR